MVTIPWSLLLVCLLRQRQDHSGACLLLISVAIGAFFSGSATISNLIFGGVQQSIATQTGLNMTSILAMQSVGGAMGNMTCINNIIAASSVSGVRRQEGYIMQKTAIPMFVYGIIAALIGLLL